MNAVRRLPARVRYLAGFVAIMLGAGLLVANPAFAPIVVNPAPTFPVQVTVGQTFPAGLFIPNNSTPPEGTDYPILTITDIDLAPACANNNINCLGGVEPGVFQLSATGVGSGPASCTGTWTITETTPGLWRFNPPGGNGTLMLATGESCTVNFTALTLRMPTTDVAPGTPGVQTNQIASSTSTAPGNPALGIPPLIPTRNLGADATTVLQATPGLSTVAASAPPQAPPGNPPPPVPATTSDTATLSPPPPPSSANGAPPTGTITFNLFGPNDATSAGAPAFTNVVPVNGFGNYQTSASAPITTPGTYRWVATYSGDANYIGSTTPCGDPAETVAFAQATPTIVTSALTPVTIGSPISDTATVTGAGGGVAQPTGTVTFTLFGPANPTCTGAPIFNSGPQPLAGGPPPTASSGNFTPTAVGTYQWVAVYSGDANYVSVTSPCGAPNESSVVNTAQATIATQAVTPVPLGGSITDTATVTGAPAPAPAPTGTVTFTLFGPGNPTCTGAPIFTSANRPLAGGPPATATSASFTPPTAGSYNWVAVYSGDANYSPATSPCGAPNEVSVVTQATPTIVTQAVTPIPIGGSITDTATVTGAPAPAPAPTGTVTFTLFGPANPTCTGAPIFTSANRPLGGGPPPTATSASFTPTAVGTYNWVAVYSGDANYTSVTSPCGAPNEASVVTQATPTISTQAVTPVAFGSPVSDVATVTGGAPPAPAPTGTVTFTLFGPGNPTCTGAPIFTSAAVPLAGGPPPTANSGPFTPTSPGTYNWVAVYSGDVNYTSVTSPCGAPNEVSVVERATATIVTSALTPVTIGSPINDTATVTGAPAAPVPTGTVTFTLFGPANPTCTGAPIFTSPAQPLAGGPPPTANSGPFTPTAVGTYNWVAVYSGDANYNSATSPCGAPNEASVVNPAQAVITTQAVTPIPIGGSITDTATVTGAPAPAPVPTGTVTFTLFGPGNPTCTGAPIFTSANRPLGGGPPPTATSASFTPTAVGTYNWVAVYSGDANYNPATSPCGAPNEASVVNQAQPAIVTSALTPVAIGSSINDTATVTGAPAPAPVPTGTVTFTLFGPANPTCTGAPIFTSAAVPLAGGPPPTANSGPFTPTAVGTYQWVAVYSGDANYVSVTSPCGAPNESSVVNTVQAVIATQAVTPINIGGTLTDTATVTGAPAPAPAPTGTVTFTLFGPNNPTCTGAPIFTSANRPLGGGPPRTATSASFTPTAVGTYQWVAVYSGDANYDPATSPCGAPNEASVVNQAPPAIVTSAQTPVTIGSSINDTATVTGAPAPAPAPTGTVTFTLFGPANPTCTGAPIFTSPAQPLAGGPPPTANSGPFTPTSPGTYQWVAVYSGDANYTSATSPCGAPNEASVVNPAQALIATQATTPVRLGASITDTATVAGAPAPAPAPTGTVTFTLFGPGNPTCTGAPIFTSANRPLGGGPPPTATSAPFTPTAVGTYQWVAVYSGDANYDPATSPCGAPNEASVVNQAQPAIVTVAPATATIGGPISDVATLSGGVSPTGTITFTLFGPNDANCTGPSVFTSTVPVNGNGNYNSGNFTPTVIGSYRWVAVYSGDANNAAVTSPCNAPGEITAVTPAQPTISTQASGPVTLSQPISDTATLTGGFSPTGTITFTLFGPNNPTCTGAAIFTSTVPVTGNGTYSSGQFTPTTPGTYNWVAVYNGDANNGPATSPCGAPNETSTVTVLPTINVDKTATPTSRPEPGGPVTYTVVVTNTSAENLTITSLNDSVYGNLTTRANSTCNTAIGTVLAPAGTYTCQFTAPFTGNANDSLTDVVTVTATNPTNVTVTDTDDATVTLTPVAPTVLVDKTAAPLSRPEPGGSFTFTVIVTNTSTAEAVTITSLTDDVYGNLATRSGSTCNTLIGTTLAPGASSPPCTFTGDFTGNAGDSQTDVVTVLVTDDDGQTATDTDDAVVTIVDVLPTITLQKTANPLTRPEPGGTFTFTVVVTNTSSEPVTITSLSDNVYGNLNGRGTCATGATLAANGGTYTCTFDGNFMGNAGAVQTDVVTATAIDNDGDTATATDDAVVSILNVVPQIVVMKDATPASLPEPGGTFTFNVQVVNNGIEPITLTALTDDVYGNLNGRGTCATGAVIPVGGSYSCQFTGNFTGDGGASQTDVVTATGVDDEGTTVTDTDDATVTITNVVPTITVLKTPSPASRPEPGGAFTYTVVVTNTSAEPVTITSLTDNVYGNLTTRANSTCTTAIGTVLAPNATYTCQFTAPFTGDAGASLTDVVTVTGVDNESTTVTATDDATVTIIGVPPTIDVLKAASPTSRPEPGGSFTFSVLVTNTSAEPVRITSLTDDIYGDLNGRGSCAIGATLAANGGTYACSFTANFIGNAGASQTDVVTVIVVDNDNQTATDTSTATVTITNVLPSLTVTKTPSPTSRPEPGGTFEFTVVVKNTSNENVTITALNDDVYGNLNGKGTCAIGAVLAPGGSYTCKFDGTFVGEGGQSQTDTVTATVTDDEGTTATATAKATVTITDVPPTVAVTKRADPTSQTSPGGPFVFTVAVTNTSAEPVTVVSLTDDVYGDLNGRGSCAVGAVLQPGATYTCSFPGDFFGNAGASQTDTVTATVRDNEGTTATATAKANVSLTLAPVIVTQQPIARTGADVGTPARLATGLIIIGLLMVAATWRSQHLGFAGLGLQSWWPWRGPEPPDGDGGRPRGGSPTAPAAPATGMGLGLPRDRRDGPSSTAPGVRTFGAPLT